MSKKVPEVVELRGVPANIDAEKFILGSILLDDSKMDDVIGRMTSDDMVLEKHRRIFTRMLEIHARGEKIDRMTIANELMRYSELESVDGLSYLITLDDNLPHVSNIDSYVRIVREKSALRRIALLGQKSMNRALVSVDTSEVILAEAQQELAELALETADDVRALNLRGVIERTPGGLNAFLQSQSTLPRMPSGYPALDEIIYGFQPKRTYVIAGDTSHGKTTLALNIVQYMALKGSPGLYFTVEMSRNEMLQRMICSKAEVSLFSFMKGRLTSQDRAALSFAANEMADVPLYLDDTANLNASDLIVQARRAKKKHGIKWIVIDYIQILDLLGSTRKGGRPSTEYEGLTAFSRAFKVLGKELDVAVIILSQFSKDKDRTTGKIRRPILSDLHGSGAMAKDADVVMFVWRPWLYTKRDEIKHHAELIIAKHRGGPLGFVNLEFRGDYTRFYENIDQLPLQIS